MPDRQIYTKSVDEMKQKWEAVFYWDDEKNQRSARQTIPVLLKNRWKEPGYRTIV
jgi:hypothetical protein